jgi:hypothetical protein
LGTAGRRFKSCCPDHPPSLRYGVTGPQAAVRGNGFS